MNKCIIQITGNWCHGYWWEVISCKTGNLVRSGGPYHYVRHSEAAKYARDDAEEWCRKNEWEPIR